MGHQKSETTLSPLLSAFSPGPSLKGVETDIQEDWMGLKGIFYLKKPR
jgi:hypothetical protein